MTASLGRFGKSGRWGVGAVRVIMLAVALIAVGACGPGGGIEVASFPAGTLGPAGTVGPAVGQTRLELVRVLGERNLVMRDTLTPFRPPEDGVFTTVPRQVFQVLLPDAPTEGHIVVYEFSSPTLAAEAATDQATYLASGPARVQSAFGARHVMRLVGSTVVLYSWVPEGIEDERQRDIGPALETLGIGVPIPA